MSQDKQVWRAAIGRNLKVLTFQASGEELRSLDQGELQLGLLVTWIVGMGRYWDNPRASWPQHLGVGSVVYVFVLASCLWLVFRPVRPAEVKYRGMATFVSLTAAPAILYAIPVERFLPMATAAQVNMWFLAVVAAWRVSLLLWYMVRGLRMSILEALVCAFLPLAAILTSLAILNLEHVVFNIMSGVSPEHRSANDDAYGVIVWLTAMSWFVGPLLLIFYLVVLAMSSSERQLHKAKQASQSDE